MSYNIGLSTRLVQECIYSINKHDRELADIYRSVIEVLSSIAEIIIQEMLNLDKDLLYWKLLSQSSPVNKYLSRLNEKLYCSFRNKLRDLIDWARESLSNISHVGMPSIYFSSSYSSSDSFKLFENISIINDDINGKILTIRSAIKDLAYNLSSIHDISHKLQSIHGNVLRRDIVAHSLAPTPHHSFSANFGTFRQQTDSISNFRSDDISTSFVQEALRDCMISVINVLKRIEGSNLNPNPYAVPPTSESSIQMSISRRSSFVKDVDVNRDVVTMATLKKLHGTMKASFHQIMHLCILNKEYPLSLSPSSLRRPSYMQRHWFRDGVVVSASVFLVHTLLMRYRDGSLSMAYNIAKETALMAYQDHVVEPVNALAKELFDTIQSREEIVSKRDLDQSKEALGRMLDDFSRSNKGMQLFDQLKSTLSHISERASSAVTGQGSTTDTPTGNIPHNTFSTDEALDALMKSYEIEMRNPVQGILFGNLSTALLIQLQKLKMHTEAAMLKMDKFVIMSSIKVLASNQLTMAGTAAMPAFLILGGLYYTIRRFFQRRTYTLTEVNLRLRLALNDVERSLLQVYDDADSLFIGKSRNIPILDDTDEDLDTSTMKSLDIAHRDDKVYHKGIMYFNLYRLRLELYEFFRQPFSDPSYSSSSSFASVAYSISNMINSQASTELDINLNPFRVMSFIMDGWIWLRDYSDPVVSEFYSIMRDVRDLESVENSRAGTKKDHDRHEDEDELPLLYAKGLRNCLTSSRCFRCYNLVLAT